jgi:predicted nuclease with TOPRIM domain
MANPISFRPTEENLEILNEREAINPNFNRTNFINRSINCYLTNLNRIQEFEGVKRSHVQNNTAHEFSMNALFEEKRKAKDEFESQLKTANDKIEELKGQSAKYKEDAEILKSKNDFLTTQASVLDKNTLKELETLRAKVTEQSKQVSSLTTRLVEQANDVVVLKEKVDSYENSYLKSAFEKVKGTKLTAKHEGLKDMTFSIDSMAELGKALSYKYHLDFIK